MNLSTYFAALQTCQPITLSGKVLKVAGIFAEASGPGLGVGGVCAIQNRQGQDILAEVIGFNNQKILIMPFGEMRGIEPGCRVIGIKEEPSVSVGEAFLGRVLDALGRPFDDRGGVPASISYPLYGRGLNPLGREIISDVIDVGVRSINGLLTVGKGQRVAIMAGSGVGKSVLMGMIAKNTTADVNVIALIGERGREVREFIEKILGTEGLKRSVVVVATSDAPALLRIRAAHLATTMAEYFRDQGRDVMLIMDSITRFAMSLREVGLAAGEPPSAKGYTPSVFVQIPKLLERAGTLEEGGSITGIYTVLVEGDDMNEPIADTVRSCADGHIVLSRALAHNGHYPAIDVLKSISRVMKDIAADDHLKAARKLIKILATYEGVADLIHIGAYSDGSDPEIDLAKEMIGRIKDFLQQGIDEKVTFAESLAQLKGLAG